MKKGMIILIGVFISLCTFSQNSHIQVSSEPGISIFLDDTYVGDTKTEFGGLIIKDVTPGAHTIKAVKEGFTPQTEKIQIKPGQVYTHTVSPLKKSVKIEQYGESGGQSIEQKTGDLKIQSLPIRIKIEIPSLGVNSDKSSDVWSAKNLPIGTYPSVFILSSKQLTKDLTIKENKELHIFVDFIDEKIEIREEDNETNSTNHSTALNANESESSGPVAELLLRSSPDNVIVKVEDVTPLTATEDGILKLKVNQGQHNVIVYIRGDKITRTVYLSSDSPTCFEVDTDNKLMRKVSCLSPYFR